MDITQDTQTDTISIDEVVVTVHTPYGEGHKLTENEASSMNQTRKENIRNNLREQIKTMKKENKSEKDMGSMVLKYSETYEFGAGGGGGRTADPVKREALNICAEKIKEAIRKSGQSLKDVTTKQLNAKAEEVLSRNPQIMDQAASIVKARAGAEIDLGPASKAPAKPAAKAS